jgi:hypothetical protein
MSGRVSREQPEQISKEISKLSLQMSPTLRFVEQFMPQGIVEKSRTIKSPWSLTFGCGQGKGPSQTEPYKATVIQGDCAHTPRCVPEEGPVLSCYNI